MHFLNLSQFFNFFHFFNEMKNNEEESFLSSVKCRIRTVYYGLVVMNFVIVIIVTWNPGKRMASLSKEKAKPGGSQLRYYLF